VLTTKLIEGTDGRKMSKTYNNCVYLEDEPEEMFGKLMSIKDELVKTYLEVCTDLSQEEADSILELHPKEAKMRLACEIVRMYHDSDAADKAQKSWQNTFSEGGVPESVAHVPAGKLRDMVHDVSMSELRRLVEQGAVSIVESGEKVGSIDAQIPSGSTIRIGKHRFLRAK
jgi:tyrosyl-tRNA synthetase